MTKTCRSCQIRAIGTGNPGTGPYAEDASYAKSVELCRPCATEAGWENMHSDDGHEDGDSEDADVAGCWVCYPELNLAAKPRSERAGSTRQGMRLTVPIRANGKAKAEAVKAQLPEGYTATIRTEKGRTTLRVKGAVTIVLNWDAYRGAFVSGTAQATNGTAKRVRNASEALRYAGV